MPETTDVSQVRDKRPKIVGLLPRNAQALLLGGVALLMTLIILFSGHNAPRPAPAPAATSLVTPPDQARIQNYRAVIEDQMRKLSAEEAELAKTKQAPRADPPTGVPQGRTSGYGTFVPSGQSGPGESAIATDRMKREYQSPFASNIALTYRSLAVPAPADAAASSSRYFSRDR